jgi:hypothetical protein
MLISPNVSVTLAMHTVNIHSVYTETVLQTLGNYGDGTGYLKKVLFFSEKNRALN